MTQLRSFSYLKTVAASMLCVAAAIVPAASAGPVRLAPYKERLFSYPRVLDENADGSFRVIDYDEARDIDARDDIPVRRVNSWYVDKSVRRVEVRGTIKTDGHSIAVDRTGNPDDARFAVIFVHGRGGDRKLGSSDWMFGGNFNRLKNLAMRNQGVYYAPSVPSFDLKGAAGIASLVRHIADLAPQASIVLACGSMGSVICWHLAKEPAAVKRLAGIMILGGVSDSAFPASAAFKADLPLFISQGSDDRVYAWQAQKRLFERIRRDRPGYPVHLVVFRTGTHGTPIRMTDWRQTLNWIFRQAPSR